MTRDELREALSYNANIIAKALDKHLELFNEFTHGDSEYIFMQNNEWFLIFIKGKEGAKFYTDHIKEYSNAKMIDYDSN